MATNFSCRLCNCANLTPILSLGYTPLANLLLTPEQIKQPEPKYPLDLVHCPECSLVQITETISPSNLFRQYVYFSSFSETMLQHAKSLAEDLIASNHLDKHSQVVEIGSNDGYLLQFYKQAGIPVLGIEPAKNIAKIAQDKLGIPTVVEFFGESLANQLREQSKCADVIHVHNVLGHVPDLNGFVKGIGILLKDSGSAIIEVPYIKDLIDNIEFDTIYHEHLSYFSLTALNQLFLRHQLAIVHIERVKIHGGSIRIFVKKNCSGQQPLRDSFKKLLAEERQWGIHHIDFYADFPKKIMQFKDSLNFLLNNLKKEGNKIAAYGASAKGSTLLNYCNIDRATLDFIADRSTYKQGYYSPGIHLPIVNPKKLLEEMPNYVLLLTWNFSKEIIHQQEEYHKRGGKFIIPFPAIQIL